MWTCRAFNEQILGMKCIRILHLFKRVAGPLHRTAASATIAKSSI